jgi:2-polyprenyl-6-methoxyphenol hydroxylase-like FAD-dependent oxidoreductase
LAIRDDAEFLFNDSIDIPSSPATGRWEVLGMLAAMREADDVFFDGVSQIRMPRWHRGRVALAGDAAYAPSFLTGQGSSLVLVGAYMLAGSLSGRDHAAGLAAYEDGTLPLKPAAG